MTAVISSLKARKILDSRGNPTIEVVVGVRDARGEVCYGRAAAPSGASKGKLEVVDFPAGGVDKALEKVGEIAPRLSGIDASDQARVDEMLHELDGTPNLSVLGGNTTVAISLAVAKAAALAKQMPLYRYLGGSGDLTLPYPLGNVIGGGKHAGGYAPDIQEYLVVPVGARRASDAVFTNAQVHRKLGQMFSEANPSFTRGKSDEGAWSPNICNEGALEFLAEACEKVSAETGVEVRPALDVAASSLYDAERKVYAYKREAVTRDPGEQLEFILDLIERFKLFYVEDPLHEEDFEGFAELTRKVGKDCFICGDDIFVTNVSRIRMGIRSKAANAIIIKPNQIGTLTDTFKAVELARRNKYMPVISHRSGETTDETIAHLAVAWRCPMIKTGVVGGERIAKLNELIRIEEDLGDRARMSGLR
ncbi:MAG: phosphopyruvate hydratase [Candidatus Hadarchaeum sp.]|uniref:phosphopyruvate hydratase n=1 Tax=Candidatus Hadarchaeum sp. TaxID=2883567 RepID=UPI003D0991FF